MRDAEKSASSIEVSQVGQRQPKLRLDDFLPYRAARLATGLSAGLAARYKSRFGLSVAEWRVMVHLTQESEISIRDIFNRVDMDRVRVSRAVQRLERRGLVSKRVNETDRRLIRLALTNSGWEMADAVSQIANAFEAELLASVKDGTARLLLNGFDALEQALKEECDPK